MEKTTKRKTAAKRAAKPRAEKLPEGIHPPEDPVKDWEEFYERAKIFGDLNISAAELREKAWKRKDDSAG